MATTTVIGNAFQEEKKEGEEEAPPVGVPVGVPAGGTKSDPSDPAPDPAPDGPPLETPSYYRASFSAHFFPHDRDPAVDASALPPRKPLSLPARYATSMARRPCAHLAGAFVVALVLSFVGFRFGEFDVAIDNAGWWSRGTEISDRASQEMLVAVNREKLFTDETGAVWDELRTVVQPDWQTQEVIDAEDDAAVAASEEEEEARAQVCSGAWYGSRAMTQYASRNLWPVWKAEAGGSALDADALHGLCEAEERTLAALEADGACHGCPDAGDGCVAPYSLVLLARLHLTGHDASQLSGLSAEVPCDVLRNAWSPAVRGRFAVSLRICANWAIRMVATKGNTTITIQDTTVDLVDPCPFPLPFSPSVVDDAFAASDPPAVAYTSSLYATLDGGENVRAMFDANEADAYDRGDGTPLEGAYDTTGEDFAALYTDSILAKDMTLAVGSAGVTIVAMVLHTRSPFLTMIGLCQILLSFPLAYFVYYFFGGIVFFPFLNFIGIFVVFALGADDVFVAVDKWKSARRELPHATTEQVAALALPDAAYSMLLTSLTTAVAFFGTAICPVGPIVCFAVFCGLLITLDYALCLFLVFPALCLYDRWRLAGSPNCCVDLGCGRRPDGWGEDAAGDEERVADASPSLMHRVLDGYYVFLHQFRWLVLALVVAGTAFSLYVALQISLPVSSEVALLPDSNEYSKHMEWRNKLLSNQLLRGENRALVVWGLQPADTGDHLDPSTFTTLVLDETFDPSPAASQSYLLEFCARLSAEFGKVSDGYECPMVEFDAWLKEQAAAATPADAYVQHCDGASSVPVAPDAFNPCMISWSKLHVVPAVLQTDGRVKIIEVKTKSNIFFDSPQSDLKVEWNAYEDWLDNERSLAPTGVNQMFHTDLSYWWFDVNQQMVKTAMGAMGIALACASVIIFISSRSFVLTLFAGFSVLYVLAAATACLVGLGWDLGFLESVLFAILIGISCDFVIHVGHAYTMYSGNVSRHHRSRFALTHMGPSIIAAAVTTFLAAVVMIFTEVTFFRKFAVVLFMTVLHALIGCFVVFLVLCDCFGPAEPTKTYDVLRAKLCGSKERKE